MLDNKIKRNKFFWTAGMGMAGFLLFKYFPINLFSRRPDITNRRIFVKLNPDAVSRSKAGGNGR